MPIFEYRALDPGGGTVKGTIIGVSLSSVADELAKKGLQVQHVALAAGTGDPLAQGYVAPAAAPPAPAPVQQPQVQEAPQPRERRVDVVQPAAPQAARSWTPEAPTSATAPPDRSALMTDVVGPLLLKVPLSQLLFFFRQLGTMLNAGVPIISSLETLSRQTRDARLQRVIQELFATVREGRELSIGLERYPEIFTPLMLSMVRAGEQGGLLDTVLLQIADYIEREIELRNMIRKSTLYPKIVLFCSIFIILGANFIIRDVLNLNGGIDTPLTHLSIWFVLIPLAALLFLFFRIGAPNPNLKPQYDAFLLQIPAIGPTVHQMAMAKFSRAFAALYHGGVPITRAIVLSADACGNAYLGSKIKPAAQALEKGDGITESLARTGAMSATVLDMTRTGETTGRIDEMLDKVADYYESDSTVKANQLAIILGVACFIVVAAYVAYIVITFYSQRFSDMSQGANG